MYGRPPLMDLMDTNEVGREFGLELHASEEHPDAGTPEKGNEPSGSTNSWEFD
jgi:hypothetical protein